MEIVNDPFKMVIEAVRGLYPGVKALIQFNPGLRGRVFNECGLTTFPDDGSTPLIDISTNVPFSAMVEILAHELAHVVAGTKAGHGKEREQVFNSIIERYRELGSQLSKEWDCG